MPIQYIHVIHTCTLSRTQHQLSGLLFIHSEGDGGREAGFRGMMRESGKRAREKTENERKMR